MRADQRDPKKLPKGKPADALSGLAAMGKMGGMFVRLTLVLKKYGVPDENLPECTQAIMDELVKSFEAIGSEVH